MTLIDWDGAPDGTGFHGRHAELGRLVDWIASEQCRVVVVRGMRGIGKSKLAAVLARAEGDAARPALVEKFDYIIWRTLENARPLGSLAQELIYLIGGSKEVEPSASDHELVNRLLAILKSHRCLIFLDNLESLLFQTGAGQQFKQGYEPYEDFFLRAASQWHASCVVLTTAAMPNSLERVCGATRPARCEHLLGLDAGACEALLDDLGFEPSAEIRQKLIDFYAGNPLALALATRYIRAVHPNPHDFWTSGAAVPGELKPLLDWHFDRLTDDARQVLMSLALSREPMSVETLQSDLATITPRSRIVDALVSIQEALRLNRVDALFAPLPVLAEYVTERAVAVFADEIAKTTSAKRKNNLSYCHSCSFWRLAMAPEM
jgi:hypothetical protein